MSWMAKKIFSSANACHLNLMLKMVIIASSYISYVGSMCNLP